MIIFETLDNTPLIVVEKKLPCEETTVVSMIFVVLVTPFTTDVNIFLLPAVNEFVVMYEQEPLPPANIFPLTSVVKHCDAAPARELNLILSPTNVPLAILKFKLASSDNNLFASAIVDACNPFTLSPFNAKGTDTNCTLGVVSLSVPIFTPR